MVYIKNKQKHLLMGPVLAKHVLALSEEPDLPENLAEELKEKMGEDADTFAMGEVVEEDEESMAYEEDDGKEEGIEPPEEPKKKAQSIKDQAIITIESDPEGNKDYMVNLDNLKFFVNPYHFL
jgi:hypothetical protein